MCVGSNIGGILLPPAPGFLPSCVAGTSVGSGILGSGVYILQSTMVLRIWEGQSAITQLYVHVALKKKGCCSRGEMGMTISVGPMHVCLHPTQVSHKFMVHDGGIALLYIFYICLPWISRGSTFARHPLRSLPRWWHQCQDLQGPYSRVDWSFQGKITIF